MNHYIQQQQQHQQQQQAPSNLGVASVNPVGLLPPPQFTTQSQGFAPLPPQHLMGLLTTNPALTTTQGGIFPPSALLSNPGAFLALQPEAFGVAAPSAFQPMVPLVLPLVPSNSNIPGDTSKQNETSNEEKHLTSTQRAQLNRDRNRDHARSTRLRKKDYVQKLKELVEGLHKERAEQIRTRRVAVQHLAEKQSVRRSVIKQFLRYHTRYETDQRQWKTLVEEDFWLKQPVTPYRSFRRAEIEKEYRISRGISSIIGDAASLAVMIESIGSRSPRWMQLKRQEFISNVFEQSQIIPQQIPRCIERQEARLHHAISSISSCTFSGESNESSSELKRNQNNQKSLHGYRSSAGPTSTMENKELSGIGAFDSTTSAPNDTYQRSDSAAFIVPQHSRISINNQVADDACKEFHDYNAKPLPDPKLGYEPRSLDRSIQSEDSPTEDSSRSGGIMGNVNKHGIISSSSYDDSSTPAKRARINETSNSKLSVTIAKKSGIVHNIHPHAAARLATAPAVCLPSFTGIGKNRSSTTRSQSDTSSSQNDDALKQRAIDPPKPASIIADLETSSVSSDTESSTRLPQITGTYHINEDDMILTEDFLMCPFVFRSADAVVCGACSECVMPGMLRGKFTKRNRLESLELIYDAMGFMQQLERASGNEGTAQIIAGSLEMALDPRSTEARVITSAQPPYLIVNVNEVWTRITGYTQMDVEGRAYLEVLEGEETIPVNKLERLGKPKHRLEEVAIGRPACSTNIHYDKCGRDFVEFVSSYPLTNTNDEITHILHVSKELPSFVSN